MTDYREDPADRPVGGQGLGEPAYGQPQGYGQPAYGAPQGYGAPYGQLAARPRNGLGTAALVLGILALVFCWTIVGGIVLGLIALGLGIAGRRRVTRREATNGGSAIAGIVLGVIGALISIALIAFGLSILNSKAGRTYQQCLSNANGNQAQINQCAREFQRNFNR